MQTDAHILIFSSNGQQQFVSSLVLHLSISSSFAERGGNEKGNYRFLWLMQQQFKLHLRNYNDRGEQEGERERVEWPFATSFLHYAPLQLATCCNAAIPHLMLHSASHCQVKGVERGVAATLLHHQRYQMQAASSGGATSSIDIDIGTCIIIMIIASCNSKS